MSDTKQPELSVVIVSYNCRSKLQQCLISLQDNIGRIAHEIIVIDNASSDGSPEITAEAFPDVILIRNPKNIGFPGANNQGIRKSRGDYVLFLNPDTIVYPNALEILMRGIKAEKKIGGVGPALHTGDNQYQISFGGKRTFFSEMIQKYCLNPFFRLRLKNSNNQRETVWLSGACLLIRKETLKETGGFDEKFFLYYEDIDMCVRIRACGWNLLFLPAARIFHYGGVSTEKQKLYSRFFYRQSQLYYYRKHNSVFSQKLLRFFLRLNFCFVFIQGYLAGKKDLAERRKFFTLLHKD